MFGLFSPDSKLSQYRIVSLDVFAAEILARPGREIIKKFYMDNPQFLKDHPGTVMRCMTYASERGEVIEGMPPSPEVMAQ